MHRDLLGESPSERLDQSVGRSRRWWLRRSAAVAAGLAVWPVFSGARASYGGSPVPARRQLAGEIEQTLWERILPAWYPRSLDTEHGGFWEHFAEDWSRRPATTKFLVFQARMTWTAAAVAVDYPQRREPYLDYTRHGLQFLRQRMWDAQHGGFVDRTDLQGRPDRQTMPWKQMYSLAFGLYAASASYEATRDPQALQLARDTFDWIEQHAHDPEHGGYFEHLTAEGQPVARDVIDQPPGRGLPVIGMVDPVHGGCFDTVAEDGSPLADRRHKATPWKTAYHVTRALLLGALRLPEEPS
jgi:mannose/cellobiose epimerase-like protein (N-acyl-D-glucosamine 2-epimerase family)